ncbi:ribbon-helix-helix domain-containing protein [Rickettsiales bacterium]|nr:ribbon-helix-helix domain-containing protein [Rickettsiales bacterium]
MTTINISAHIPVELSNKLEKVCKLEERSKSYYIKKSLEQYLSQRLEDIEDYYDADQSYMEFKKSGESSVPLDEVLKDI